MSERRLCRNSIHKTLFWIMLCCLILSVIQFIMTDHCVTDKSNSERFWIPSSPSDSASSSSLGSTSKKTESTNTAPPEDPDNDFIRKSYCNSRSPCIALLSASHHGGITSLIDPKTLSKRSTPHLDTSILHKRILVREGYCAIHQCDVIIDFNDYTKNRTMWLSDSGKHKIGQMPPHWNKVAALRRWLPHYDGILQMDMDSTWISFNHNVYDLFHDTSNVFSNGGPELVMFKTVEMSHCVVDSWWFHGTGIGCRYVKYPQNHKGQTQNLDMPWFWYALLHCAQVYGAGPFECLNTCNGPKVYVDNLMKDPNHGRLAQLWIRDCFAMAMYSGEIEWHTNATMSRLWQGKHLNLNMAWGNKMNFSESFKNSVSVHCKDTADMISWLNRTAELMMDAGCTEQSCFHANISMMQNFLT